MSSLVEACFLVSTALASTTILQNPDAQQILQVPGHILGLLIEPRQLRTCLATSIARNGFTWERDREQSSARFHRLSFQSQPGLTRSVIRCFRIAEQCSTIAAPVDCL